MIDINTIYAGIALAATGGIVYSLKSIPNRLWQKIKRNLIYNVKIYQYDELFSILESYLYHKYNSKYRGVEASLREEFATPITINSNEKENDKISYKQEETTFIVKYRGKNLIITKDKEKLDKAQNIKDVYFRKYNISGLKAKKQIDDFLNEAIDFSKSKKEENIIKVCSNSNWGEWLYPKTVKIKPFNKTIINQNVKTSLLKELDEFNNSEQWYINANIPYKRGLCLYGPPGTGKTTLALAIANYTKRKVYCLNLNCIENDSNLPRAFSDMEENAILLIEDIDRVFVGRENVRSECKITFSALLNCLDGAFYKHGLITIITTNHIDKLDEALLRTGRIDTKIEIPLPTEKEISEYLAIFYNKPTFVIQGSFNFKMSDIQEICLQNKNNFQNALKMIENEKIS